MRIAVPVVHGKLSAHFGHCESFSLLDFDGESRTIVGESYRAAPAHQPGVLPRWLAEQDVNVIIAGGMGSRARNLFESHGIEVVVGAPMEDPVTLANSYLNGSLPLTGNQCDHGDGSEPHRCSH